MTPAVWAAFAATINVAIAVIVALTAHWSRVTATADDALKALTSSDAIRMRHNMSKYAHKEKLSEREKDQFIHDALGLLWAIQRADFTTHIFKKTAIAPTHGKWLYRNLDMICKDLSQAISRHGQEVDWQPTLKHTNEVLRGLPKKVKNEWAWRPTERKDFDLIAEPNENHLDPPEIETSGPQQLKPVVPN